MKSAALTLVAALILAGLATPLRARGYLFPKDFGMVENGPGIKYSQAIIGGYREGQYLLLRLDVSGNRGVWSGHFTVSYGNPICFLMPRLNPDDIVNWADDKSPFQWAQGWPYVLTFDVTKNGTWADGDISIPVGSWQWVSLAASSTASSIESSVAENGTSQDGLLFRVGSSGGRGPPPAQFQFNRVTIRAGHTGVMMMSDRDALTDEHLQIAADWLLRQDVAKIYAPLLQSLGLNETDTAALKDLLARRQAVLDRAWAGIWEKSRISLPVPFPKSNPRFGKSTRTVSWYSDADRAAWTAATAGPVAPIEMQIRALLGGDKAKAWQPFEKTVTVRRSLLPEFEGWQSRGVAPLTSSEIEKVIVSVVAANPAYGTAYDVAVGPAVEDAKKFLKSEQARLLADILEAKAEFYRSVGIAMAERKP